MMSRRRRRQYFVGVLLGALLLVNVLFFAIVFYKARSEYADLGAQIVKDTAEKARREKLVLELEETQKVLESFPSDRMEFLSRHLVSRKDAFAQIVPILDEIATDSGVRKTRVEYSAPSPIPQYGMYLVRIKLPVQGDYGAVRKFISLLQNSPIVFIVTAIDVHGGSTSEEVEESAVSLTLAMETYFYDELS
jgi:hypothetical protein